MLYATHQERVRDLALAIILTLAGCAAEREDEAALLSSEGIVPIDVGVDMDASVLPNPGVDSGVGADAAVDAGWRRPPVNWLAKTVAGSPIVAVEGPGCPGGIASLAPDGETLTIVFDAFEARIRQNQTIAFKLCQLVIKMHGADKYSYAVREALLRGSARLESGQKASVQLQHYSAGNPVPGLPRRTDLTGPYEGAFSLAEVIPDSDRVWSACGYDRYLNVSTRVNIRSEQRKEGYISLTPVEAHPDANLHLKIEFKKCS